MSTKFFAKSLASLNSDEGAILKIIYSMNGEVGFVKVYKILKAEVNVCYTKFYEIINKLERLRLIVVGNGWERTRYIIKKYRADLVLKVLTKS